MSLIPSASDLANTEALFRFTRAFKVGDPDVLSAINSELRSRSPAEILILTKRLNEEYPSAKLNVFMLDAIPEVSGFSSPEIYMAVDILDSSYERIKDNDADGDLSRQIAGCVGKILDGYRHRTGLNLLPGLRGHIGVSLRQYLYGTPDFDRICSEHLGRSFERKKAILQTDLAKLARFCGDLGLINTTGLAVRHILKFDDRDLGNFIGDIYHSNRLTPPIINEIAQSVGTPRFLEMAKQLARDQSGGISQSHIIEVFGESSIITKESLEESLEICSGEYSRCPLIARVIESENDDILEARPLSRDYIYSNLDDFTKSKPAGLLFNRLAHKYSHSEQVIDTYVSRLVKILKNADRDVENREFDYDSSTSAAIINRSYEKFYNVNWCRPQLEPWRNALIDVVLGAGVIPFKNLIVETDNNFRRELTAAADGIENKVDIVQRIPEIRGAWFVNELGV